MKASRKTLIKRIMWNHGGTGFGLCSFAGMMLHSMQTPSKDNPDWKATVAISGPPDKYTDEELEKLAEFSARRTAAYDKMFNVRMGANLICIDKIRAKCWLRKRMTWEIGQMYSPTIDEAIAVFDKEYGSKPKEGPVREPAKA